MTTLTAQNKVTAVDLDKYAGKWFVIASIPTSLDKKWNYITETYTLAKKGTIDIYTTYIKLGKTKQRSVTSKGFPDKKSNNTRWKVQFVWPFKADYLIEELGDDYSYTVVGHPEKKFLYIMNRSGKMPEEQYLGIVERCKQKGYDTGLLHKIPQ